MKKISLAQRDRALGLLDRAIEAKYNELWREATRLAFEAREADPSTPGVDIFIGELAFERNEMSVLASAARAALEQHPASANAKLLLALQAWILRGQTGTTEAGVAATQTLQEAAADELSNGPVRFFAGDFLRAIGRPAEAHANLLGGLYRLHGWQSAALVAAKLSLAVEEAGSSADLVSTALSDPSIERFGFSSADLHRAIVNGGDADSAASALRSIFTAKQVQTLSHDSAFATAYALSAAQIMPVPRSADAEQSEEILVGEPDGLPWRETNSFEANRLKPNQE